MWRNFLRGRSARRFLVRNCSRSCHSYMSEVNKPRPFIFPTARPRPTQKRRESSACSRCKIYLLKRRTRDHVCKIVRTCLQGLYIVDMSQSTSREVIRMSRCAEWRIAAKYFAMNKFITRTKIISIKKKTHFYKNNFV